MRKFILSSPPLAGGLAVFALAAFASPVAADDARSADVTYTRDIAPIMLSNCAQCHRPGAAAPMSLLSYDETRPWAKSIKTSVQSRQMPPWGADTKPGVFHNDLLLTSAQIENIVRWVDAGAPMGDPAAMPPAPTFPESWHLGEPDYVIELDEIDVPADGPDYFPNIRVVFDIPDDKWVAKAEVLPGNTQVLHHVVGFLGEFGMNGDGSMGASDESQKSAREARRNGQRLEREGLMNGDRPRRSSRGGAGDFTPEIPIIWAVGSPPIVYPDGMGRQIPAGSPMTINMHYHPNGSPQKDRTKIGFWWGEGEMKKAINTAFAGTMTFKIPANTPDHRLDASYIFDEDARIVSYFPHMHMRGKSMKYTATYPDGRKEVLLDVPRYSFNWQWFYYPIEPQVMPKGTRIDIEARYDNSDGNPFNPDPNKVIGFGEGSDQEMMFGVVEYIVEEGVRPKPVNPKEKVARILASVPRGEGYEVQLKMGMMSLPTALHLPRQGAGTWYFPFGSQMMTSQVRDLVWTGDKFAMNMEMMGTSMVIKATGEITPDGKIKGDFDLSGLDLPEDARRFAMQGFEGKLVSEGEVASAPASPEAAKTGLPFAP